MIKEEILNLNENADVRIRNFDNVREEVWDFCPNVILTIPPRNYWVSNWLMMVKAALGCSVVVLLTEGFFYYNGKKEWKKYVGTNNYSEKLVDYFLFWGNKTKEGYLDILAEDKKITEVERAKVVGYAYYDINYFKSYADRITMPRMVQNWIQKGNKHVLCLTGFMAADYTIKEFDIEGSIGGGTKKERKLEIDAAERRIKAFYEYRKGYINNIIQCAAQNPDISFLIKLHPAEFAVYFKGKNYQFYHILDKYLNIYLLDEAVPLGMLLPYTDVMVHYGSTSGLEAYLYEVPTLHMFSEAFNGCSRMPGYCIYQSNRELTLEDFEQFNESIVRGVPFDKLEDVEKILHEQFDWEKGKKDYHPAERIAKYILESWDKKQVLDKDKLFKKAVKSVEAYQCRKSIKSKVKWLNKQKKYNESDKYLEMLSKISGDWLILFYDLERKIIETLCHIRSRWYHKCL